MTPQEQNMLGDLISRVQSTNLTEKDPDAQNLLNQQLSGHPDALYVLAQTVLVQNYALDQAKKQMEQLKQQAATPAPAKATSFLGSIFGHTDKEAAAPIQYAPVPQQQYAQAPPSSQWSTPQGGQAYQQQGYPPQAYPPPAYGAPQAGAPSFLRSAATTAAGVAAGALAFEGVESLMHGFGQHAGFGGGGGFGGEGYGGGGFGGAPREEVINNYYDSPGGEGRGDRDDDRGGNDRDGDRYASDDASSRDMPAIQDASYTGPQSDNDLQPEVDQADDVNVSDDSGSYDDASNDGGGGDDSSFV